MVPKEVGEVGFRTQFKETLTVTSRPRYKMMFCIWGS